MGKLVVRNLSKSYGTKNALDNFSFSIEPGEIVGLIGKNGAGKTTLLNCLAGNNYPDSGEIIFDDWDLLRYPEARSDFGILIEPSFLDYMNTYDNLRLLLNAQGIWDKAEIKRMSDEVLEMVGLKDKGKIYVKQFSFGMKQRLGFAQALLNGKKFMILDEPFVGLDINGRAMVKEYIRKIAKERQIGIIFSDHNLDEVRSLCERVIVIREGQKIADTILKDEKVYELHVGKTDNALEDQLKSDKFVKVDRERKVVMVSSDKSLNKTIASIMNVTAIKSIDVIEDSLDRMVRGE